MTHNRKFEVVIIGGSYAGLSAAMALGRSMRKVLIIDSGLPCNRQTPHSHNFITQDGEAPAAIAEKAKMQVLSYETVSFHHGFAIGGKKTEDGFSIMTQNGEKFEAKKLIFATGITDLMPDVKGFADCWGISVIHCPYCHGYEFRNQKTAVMANGDRAFHIASLVSNLSPTITLLTSGEVNFSDEQLQKLNEHKIAIITAKVSEIVHEQGQVQDVVFDNGTAIGFDAVYAAIPFEQHSDIPAFLGCEFTENGHVKVDASQKTNVKGIYACGDNASAMRSVANAVYTGNVAGAMVNHELTVEEF